MSLVELSIRSQEGVAQAVNIPELCFDWQSSIFSHPLPF